MEPVAIIGIGCRFPGADGPDQFWRLLRDGGDAITEVPPDRWDADGFYDADGAAPGKTNSRWGGFLRDIDRFDREFFGISPREASTLDPQQRLLLEVTWEAFEDAGQVPAALAGGDAGVFVGISTYDYALLQAPRLGAVDAYWGTGNALSVAANRISYMFDLHGPSIAVDTACSSSLVAAHMACQSLWNGESRLAVVGGVNVILSPIAAINFAKAGVMAPDGRCKTFDAGADGYVRSEGAGVVVLKPLSRALADGDPIRAVIRGGAVAHDGRTNGLMAPNSGSQEALLRAAYRHSGVAAGDVDYVEAHGTGTFLGDLMEARALADVVGRGRPPDRPCIVGALKSNIGHLEAAAGIAGLIKTALMLEHRQVPPSLHVRNPNPRIDFERLRLRVARALEPWPDREGPARAGVSSFGFGGTNAHLVLEEAPAVPESERDGASPDPEKAVLVPISARGHEALRQAARRFLDVLGPEVGNGHGLASIAHTAGARRSHHRHRLALVATARERAADQTHAFLAGAPHPGVATGDAGPRRRRLVFVCPGQGPRWWPLDPALREEPALLTTLEECERLVRAQTGWSLLEQLWADETASRLDEPDFCQPALFALQVALAELWRSWGITPDAVVGHSVGEVAAAYLAGAVRLDEAVRVACRRGQVIRTASGSGRMAVLELSAEAAHEALRGYADRVSVAAINGPTSTVISGDVAAIDEITGRMRADGVFCRILESVDFASHSPHMDPLKAELAKALGDDVRPTPVRLPMYSTVTGAVADGETLDGAYWAENLRAPVLFDTAVTGLLETGHDVFVELSSHPMLLAAIAQRAQGRGREAVLLASLRRAEPPRETLLTSLGKLYTVGFDPAWDALRPEPARPGRPVRLPGYPWQRERCWFDPRRGLIAHQPGEDAGHPLLGRHVELAGPDGDHVWQGTLGVGAPAFLGGHRVDGAAVVPAAAWLEMARAAAAVAIEAPVTVLTGVEFRRMLRLADAGASTTQLRVVDTGAQGAGFRVFARPAEDAHDRSAWTLHVTGTIASGEPERAAVDLDAVRGRCGKTIDVADLYAAMRSHGLEYGPSFRGVGRLWRGEGEALAALAVPSELDPELDAYGIHPALLDAGLQVLGAALQGRTDDENPRPYVPVRIDRAILQPGLAGPCAGRHLWVHARVRPGNDVGPSHAAAGDVTLTDGDGQALAVLEGVHLRRLTGLRGAGLDRALYELRWRRADRRAVERAGAAGGWLLFADGRGVASDLAGRLADGGERAVLVVPGAGYDESGPDRITIRPDSAADVRRAVSAARTRMGTLRGVAHLWSLDAPSPDRSGVTGLRDAQVRGAVSVLHLIQTLTSAPGPPRLWLVTSGVHGVGAAQAPVSVAQAPVWGLGRVAALEHPELHPVLVDLDHVRDHVRDVPAAWLADELRADDDENEVACRDGERYVARLVPAGTSTAPTVPSDAVRANATYLITGGLGALGLHVAGWLVEHGARHLVLVGRRGPDEGAEQRLRTLRDTGAEVRPVRADVGDEQAFSHALAEATEFMPPLRGVVHAAGVLDDATLHTLTAERLLAVFEPKVAGAWNVHACTAHLPLDFFVMFSSAAAVLGSPGQGNYAAANAFVDALASLRASQGRPALSVAWGPWEDAGLAVRSGGADRLAALAGIEGIEPADGVEIFGRLLGARTHWLAVMPIDRRRWAERPPVAARSPLVAELAVPDAATPPDGGRGALTAADLLAADPADQQELLESYLRVEIARALEMPLDQLDIDEPLTSIGVDSLVAVGVKNQIEVELGMSLPLADALEGSSLREIAARMLAGDPVGATRPREDGTQEMDWEEFEIL
ncbi:SDR family NAD(P)-dependent oxidoreductase [Actinomadura sp. KC216]|uniref:type I polyketide synthase n=1 Tax=Actinomadura sp. KC216 TaxID=2530370 RepID=UPI00104C404B|nr:type I polyketide synthase [Actinomadura sp. KC216]TDB90608.1 SDR family NAD(P)-dependent oxidoreductase [Actinomadura sp. KC216]